MKRLSFACLALLTPAICVVAMAPQQRATDELPVTATLPPFVAVKPIEPPGTPLPPETASAGITRFSFVGYGDTRGTMATDGRGPHPVHSRLMDRMIATVRERSSTPFPIRFVLQSGDAVYRGLEGTMWNVSFTPIIERLTHGADVPYFFVAGNHDVTNQPAGSPNREMGLHQTLTAISRLIPPEGSPRRLSGYTTYAFGYGNAFVIGFDSNIASDTVQLAWVTDQLEHLDRARFPHVIVFMHHPPYSSGPHSGASAEPMPGTGRKAPDRVEPTTAAIRSLYMPLFRRHHVRLLIVGHEHLFEHWVERYVDQGTEYRLDTVVTGGGGAPTYVYNGEPDLRAYVAASPSENIRLEHLVKPGATAAENPNHFVLFQVDGNHLSLEVIAGSEAPYLPYGGARSKVSLDLSERP